MRSALKNVCPTFFNFEIINECLFLIFSHSLVKDYKHRPKYKKLLEYPFIKKYEKEKVDVSKWFKGMFLSSLYSYIFNLHLIK